MIEMFSISKMITQIPIEICLILKYLQQSQIKCPNSSKMTKNTLKVTLKNLKEKIN